MSKNMVPLGEVVDFIGGGTPSRDVNHYWNGEIPWASVKDFKAPTTSKVVRPVRPIHQGANHE
jgi:type I restriction enzyme, S subunit